MLSVAFDSSGRVAFAGVFGSSNLMLYNSDGALAASLPQNQTLGAAFVSVFSSGGNHIWSTRLDGSDRDAAWGVAFDSSGRLVIGGNYKSSQILIYNSDGSLATFLHRNATGAAGIFLAMYSTTGTLQWATRIDGDGSNYASSVAIDTVGRVAVTGYCTSSQLLVYNAVGSVARFMQRMGSVNNAFISVFDSIGVHLWSTRLDGDNTQYSASVKFDLNGRVAVAGSYISSQLLVYHSNGTLANYYDRTGGGSENAYISVFTSNGIHAWTVKMDGNGWNYLSSVALDANGRIAVSGIHFSSPMSIYHVNGSFAASISRNASTVSAFVSVFTSNGYHLWSSRMDGNGDDYALAVAFDTNGQVAVTGHYMSTQLLIYNSDESFASFLSINGTSAAFLSLFTSTGRHLWSTRLDGEAQERANSVAFDSNGRVAVAGRFASPQIILYCADKSIGASLTLNGTQAGFAAVFQGEGITSTESMTPTGSTSSDPNLNLNRLYASGNYQSSTSSFSHGRKDPGVHNMFLTIEALLALAGIIFIILLSLAVTFILKARRRRQIIKSSQVSSELMTMSTMDSATVIEQLLSNTTWINTTTTALSIPAFMEVIIYQDFQIGRLIAKGGCGSIYLGDVKSFEFSERTNGEKIVVKNLGTKIDKLTEAGRLAFEQELALMYMFCKHPNFVRLFGFCTDPSCIVMKYYGLGDLEDYVKGHGPVTQMFAYSKLLVVELLKQFSEGVSYMHAKGIAHSDIKPKNVLLDMVQNKLLVVISDFGIAHIIDDTVRKVDAFQLSELNGGTFQYAAPEIARLLRSSTRLNYNRTIWKHGDTYALGMVILAMLKRRDPWTR